MRKTKILAPIVALAPLIALLLLVAFATMPVIAMTPTMAPAALTLVATLPVADIARHFGWATGTEHLFNMGSAENVMTLANLVLPSHGLVVAPPNDACPTYPSLE